VGDFLDRACPGIPSFAIIGAQVALMADLAWYWVPISAALTCSGGGMLLDIVTGREPVTFQGEPYEEVASAGSLVLLGCLLLADHFEWHNPWPVAISIAMAWAFVFFTRLAVVHCGWKSWRLKLRHSEP
jgi:NitT/TauT family transport system substrate-binding protein